MRLFELNKLEMEGLPPPPTLGEVYDTVALLKHACRAFAIENNFEFKTLRSSKTLSNRMQG